MTEEEARRELARHIVENKAKLLQVAHAMGYSREATYQRIYRHKLWPLVNKVREDLIEQKKMEKKHGLPNERSLPDEDQ